MRNGIIVPLHEFAIFARLQNTSAPGVLSHFINDVVVNFSREAEGTLDRDPRSTLSHASKKAVESYFALSHLLICVATEHPKVILDTHSKIARFLDSKTMKTICPNLGHLLVAALISDQGLTQELTIAVTKETILRNVVWMLDTTDASTLEFSYLEPSPISDYRLQKTFGASRTSYRLLMFLALFYRHARISGKSVAAIRDDFLIAVALISLRSSIANGG
ncbi:MAG: hypothetical protein L6R41_003978 [Letrouitia leprolyta]|nr:MAG: hypothetical protein L6R41_003978 [Letrouitia leprolyta]